MPRTQAVLSCDAQGFHEVLFGHAGALLRQGNSAQVQVLSVAPQHLTSLFNEGKCLTPQRVGPGVVALLIGDYTDILEYDCLASEDIRFNPQ